MSRIFGPIYQNGYIVADLDAALDQWTRTMGVGPFYRMPVSFQSYAHRGVRSDPVLEVALGYSGDLQIELIQQVNDEPSHYREFLERHGPGLQHVSFSTETFDDDLARWRKAGFDIVVEGTNGTNRFIFMKTDLPGSAGAQVEVLELSPSVKQFFEMIRLQAASWDGTDPIRRPGG